MKDIYLKKKGFVLYQDFQSTLMQLSIADRGRLITALFEYHGTGYVSFPMKGMLGIAFSTLRATLDRDAERYAERCERNRKNGAKGGRPSKTVMEEIAEEEKEDELRILENFQNPEKPKKPDREIEKEKNINITREIGRGREKESLEAPSPKVASPAAPPPSSPSGREKEELYRLGVPTAYWREHWEKACEYCKENTYWKVPDILYIWWKQERDQKNGGI